MISFTPALIVVFAAYAFSSPIAEPMVTPAPAADSLQKRTSSCTFSGSNCASLASVSQKDCVTIVLSSVAVPSSVTLDLSELEDDTTVIFEGTTTWGYKEWNGPLLQIEGTSITIEGASGAILNPDGARWRDGAGTNGGKTKPKFFYAHDLTSSTIKNLYIENTPVQAVSIDGADGLTITDMTIDNSAGDTEGGHNTDGFDIGDSSDVTNTGATVYSQDDCAAVNSGTDITFRGGLCSGCHGLSIESVGGRSDNTVESVAFESPQVESSVNGIRIKATEGDTGTIKGLTYDNYGVLIEQDYDGGDLEGSPTGGIPITDLTIENISGSGGVESSAYNIAIVCASGACSDWTWSSVEVTGGKTYGSCENAPSPAKCSA